MTPGAPTPEAATPEAATPTGLTPWRPTDAEIRRAASAIAAQVAVRTWREPGARIVLATPDKPDPSGLPKVGILDVRGGVPSGWRVHPEAVATYHAPIDALDRWALAELRRIFET